MARQAVQREYARRDHPDARGQHVIQDDGVSAYRVTIFDRPGGREVCALVGGRKGRRDLHRRPRPSLAAVAQVGVVRSFTDTLRPSTGRGIVIDGDLLNLEDKRTVEYRSAGQMISPPPESPQTARTGRRPASRAQRSPGAFTAPETLRLRLDRSGRERRLVTNEAEAAALAHLPGLLRGRLHAGHRRVLNEEGVPGPGGGDWGRAHSPSCSGSSSTSGRSSSRRGVRRAAPPDHRPRHLGRGAPAPGVPLEPHERARPGQEPDATHLLTRGMLKCWCGRVRLPRSWENPAGRNYDHYSAPARLLREGLMPAGGHPTRGH